MLLYLLKSSFLLLALWLPYSLLMRRESFFRFNRGMLLLIVAVSVVLPLFSLHLPVTENCRMGMVEIGIPQVVFEAQQRVENMFTLPEIVVTGEQTNTWNLSVISLTVYLTGVGLALAWRLRNLWRMWRFIHCGVLWQHRDDDGVRILCHADEKTVPFSFFHTIVISEKDYNEHGREILLHERAHILCRHSYDVLFVQLAQVIWWFNPCIYLLARDLADVHEFEADSAVLSSGVSARNYQLLLIKKAVGSSSYTFANSFNHSLLKKRITMMLQKKSSPWRMAKSLYIAPVAMLAVLAFATPELSSCNPSGGKVTENQADDRENAEENKTYSGTVPEVGVSAPGQGKSEARAESEQHDAEESSEVFEVCEVMPEYPGGMEAMMKFMQRTITYPAEAKENGEEGRVLVTFVVEKDGSITEPTVVKSVSPSLDAEAMRVVKLMPAWKPGTQRGKNVRTKFTIPVVFRLN